MTTLESSVSDATIWSITLEPSNTILEVLFTFLIYFCSTDFTQDDYYNMLIVQTTGLIYFSKTNTVAQGEKNDTKCNNIHKLSYNEALLPSKQLGFQWKSVPNFIK